MAGLPDLRDDHAVVIGKFTRQCMVTMETFTKELEISFGPDTGELSMRFGLPFGPVAARVLHGDRSRSSFLAIPFIPL